MTLSEKIVQELIKQRKTVTTAESCTGGLIAAELTNVSGASSVFECGFVTYANRIKTKALGVKESTLRSFGAVSKETAKEMAEGAKKQAGADFAIAVTGIAGPLSDDTEKPVGLIFIACAEENGTEILKLENHFTENVREQNREAAKTAALELLWRHLTHEAKQTDNPKNV